MAFTPQKVYKDAVPIPFAAAVLVMAFWWLALQFIERHDTPANYLFNAGYGAMWLYGGLVGLSRLKRWGGVNSAVGRAVLFISLAVIANALGQFIWTYYNLVLGIEVPKVSWADFFWGLSYPLVIIGILLILRRLPARFDPWRVAVSFFSAFGIGTVTVIVLWPTIRESLELANIVNLGYILADIVLISMVMLALSVWGGQMGRFLLYFVLGSFITGIADVLYAYLLQNNTYWNGDLSDLLFAAGAFLNAAALVIMRPETLPQELEGVPQSHRKAGQAGSRFAEESRS